MKKKRTFLFLHFLLFPSFLRFGSMNSNVLLFHAARTGNVTDFKRILEENPGLDINWQHPSYSNRTSLHIASQMGHHEIVKILLAHPLINVNILDEEGLIALSLACEEGNTEVVHLLCEDLRVEVNLTASKYGYIPLYLTVCFHSFESVKWLMALRGEDLDLGEKASYDGTNWTTSLEIAGELGFTEIISLLERFTANPAQVQYELRVELGLPASLASELFAVVVFLCDDLLKIRHVETQTSAGRFFSIAAMLPMELQMLLCHRVVGSTKQNILSRDSEHSFRLLAKVLGS